MHPKSVVWPGLVLAGELSLPAAILNVSSLANIGPGSLRDQVAASTPGDTIAFVSHLMRPEDCPGVRI